MGEKDVTEKMFEDYNDVFSDIVNGIVFHGVDVVKEEDLHEIHPVSEFKAFDNKTHMLERDVIKIWKHGLINIALVGLENQTE